MGVGHIWDWILWWPQLWVGWLGYQQHHQFFWGNQWKMLAVPSSWAVVAITMLLASSTLALRMPARMTGGVNCSGACPPGH